MRVGSPTRRGLVNVVALVALASLALGAAGCASKGESAPTPTKPSPSATGRTDLTFAVYGPKPVVAAYKRIAVQYTAVHPAVRINVDDYPDHAEAMEAYQSASQRGDAPDIFLMDHGDLGGLIADKAVRPLDALLAAREVDFGDGFIRTALEAFSSDSALQCMPQDVSPLVVYYNPRVIELDKIAQPGRRPVSQDTGWNLDEFRRAAQQARRPGVRGFYIAPDLEQVAPFVWSGGGDIVDDPTKPTTLTLADGSSQSALEKLLEVVRNPALTFGQTALHKRSALQRFEDGKLGMILGYRDLTPVLRAHQSLTFDVMPLPRIGKGTTESRISGLCLSSKSQHVDAAADFLKDLIDDPAATTLARTGYVMPANLDVVNSDDFLQEGQRPLHSGVFSKEVRDTQLLPSVPEMAAVNRLAANDFVGLWYDPVILPLQDRLTAIDQASVPIFTPSKASESPSPSP